MERIEKRVPVRAGVLVETDDLVIETETQNLSSGGVFLRGVLDLPVGTVVTLRLTFEEGVFICGATVRWIRYQAVSATEPAGCGCQFADITDEEREILRDIAKRHDVSGAQSA